MKDYNSSRKVFPPKRKNGIKSFSAGLIVNNYKTVIESVPGFRWSATPKVECFI